MQGTSMCTSYDDLFMLLNLPDPLYLPKDIDQVFRTRHSLGNKALGQAAWLLNMIRFQIWVQSWNGMPDIVLVNGHLTGSTPGRVSALSVLAASFSCIKHGDHFVILSHFCGLHSDPKDPISGPRGMLRCLTAQLIFFHRRQMGHIDTILDPTVLSLIASQNIDGLCELFQLLFCQLPLGFTVYCVIDNISEFETNLAGWETELCRVVDFLNYMVFAFQGKAVLKVLLTATTKSIKVYRQIDPANSIDLSPGSFHPHALQQLYIEQDCKQALSPT
jgi:hypothetical protein